VGYYYKGKNSYAPNPILVLPSSFTLRGNRSNKAKFGLIDKIAAIFWRFCSSGQKVG
jgi:hypothetical protein